MSSVGPLQANCGAWRRGQYKGGGSASRGWPQRRTLPTCLRLARPEASTQSRGVAAAVYGERVREAEAPWQGGGAARKKAHRQGPRRSGRSGRQWARPTAERCMDFLAGFPTSGGWSGSHVGPVGPPNHAPQRPAGRAPHRPPDGQSSTLTSRQFGGNNNVPAPGRGAA